MEGLLDKIVPLDEVMPWLVNERAPEQQKYLADLHDLFLEEEFHHPEMANLLILD